MTIAVLPENGTEPAACFEDMDTALAWGLQQFKGKPFIVRVFTGDDSVQEVEAPPPSRRKPAAKAVAQVLKSVDEELREASHRKRAVAH